MQCEGLDSEYTVMSSASYLIFGRTEGWKCRGFLELASAHVLHLPSIASRVFQNGGHKSNFWKAPEQRKHTGMIPSTSARISETVVQSGRVQKYMEAWTALEEIELI